MHVAFALEFLARSVCILHAQDYLHISQLQQQLFDRSGSGGSTDPGLFAINSFNGASVGGELTGLFVS